MRERGIIDLEFEDILEPCELLRILWSTTIVGSPLLFELRLRTQKVVISFYLSPNTVSIVSTLSIYICRFIVGFVAAPAEATTAGSVILVHLEDRG
jgi:hypothetical protein